MKKILFTVVMAAILSVSCVSNKPLLESPNTREEFADTFDMIHSFVAERYSHFNNKGIDPSALYDKYSVLIGDSGDLVTFKLNMVQYFAELKNMHSQIGFEVYGVYCNARLVEERVFVDRIIEGRYAGLHEKDEIIAVDDVPVMEWILENAKYVSASTGSSL